MQESWRNYVKMGTVHFMSYPECLKGEGPILETLTKIVEDDFFEMVEISWVKDSEVRRQVRDLLACSGMTVGYGAQPMMLANKVSLCYPREFAELSKIKACIDEAAYLGAPRVALLSGKAAKNGKVARNILIENLKEICAYGAKKGIGIVLETFDRNIDKKCLIGPAKEAAEVAQAVRKDFPDFGIIYDLSHVPLLKEDPWNALIELKAYLVHVHIGNCVMRVRNHPLYGDNHPPFCVPGGENSVEELRSFLRILLSFNYLDKYKKEKPTISFEVKPLPGQNPEVVIAQSKRVFYEAWRGL